MNFTKEQIDIIKNTKSVDELKAVAKEHGFEVGDKQIEIIYANFHDQPDGKISDDELENVSGGSFCGGRGNLYSSTATWVNKRGKYGYYLIVTAGYSCKDFEQKLGRNYPIHDCANCYYGKEDGMVTYCTDIDNMYFE